MLRRLGFLRGKTMSEKDSPPMVQTDKLKRPSTVPENGTLFDFIRYAGNLRDSHHQYLFNKLLQEAPKKFLKFEELPKKVRVKIWGYASEESRAIRLRVQYRGGDYKMAEFGAPLPVLLWVNQESRNVVKEHYHFFEQNLAFKGGVFPSLPTKPIMYCINPATDRISVNFQSLFNNHFGLFVKAMFNYIPECMDAIRVLKIVDVYQVGFAHQQDNAEAVKQFLTKTVARFHHLKDIQFFFNERKDLDPDIVRVWRGKVIKAFAREKRKVPECNIPTVSCISWQAVDAMSLTKIEHRP